jgi:hypothetical protein
MDENVDVALERRARWAVRRWAAFPISSSPRPCVLVSGVVVSRGFRDGAAKDACLTGRIEWRVNVPERVRKELDSTAENRTGRGTGESLQITHAGTGHGEFATDRGRVSLPAWWIQGPKTLGPIWVLDPGVVRWRPADNAAGPPPPLAVPGALRMPWPLELDPDRRSILIPWLGSHPIVETFPRAELVETPTAVAAVPTRKDMGYRGWVTAVGIRHDIQARLRDPLGNRVFVDLLGNPVPVLSSPQQARPR